MKRLLLLALSIQLAPALASEQAIEFQCPQRIMTTQALASPAPEWRSSAERPFTTDDEKFKHNSEHNLETVLFYEGVPEDRASLVPDNEHKAKAKVWDARWEFSQSEKIWLTCLYRQTTVMLSRQLPPGVKRCFVRFDETKGVTVQRVWCEK